MRRREEGWGKWESKKREGLMKNETNGLIIGAKRDLMNPFVYDSPTGAKANRQRREKEP